LVTTTVALTTSGTSPLIVQVQDADPDADFHRGHLDQLAGQVACLDPASGESLAAATSEADLLAR
jgi:hypothetical protein